MKRIPILGVILATCVMCMTGCGAKREQIYPKYVAKETENGVWIFEFDPGNQGSTSDGLSLFTTAFQEFNKAHPELTVTRLETIQATVHYEDIQKNRRSAQVTHVLVYTQPKSATAVPPKEAPPKGK